MTHELPRRFGLAVRELREARGWSQERLAGEADLNRTYLGEIERGSASPSLVTIAKLAIALDTGLAGLVGRCEAPAPAACES